MTTYNSVAEIYEAIDETRGRLYEIVSGLSDGRENIRDAPGRWSVAEIVEHLAIIEGQVGNLVGMVLTKAESDGAPPAGEFKPISPDDMIERTRGKIEAPEFVRPAGATPLADSLARLRQSRAALHALRPRIEARDLSEARYPHPVFGPTDLYHWLLFIGLHEERHRRQIEGLLSASDGEGKGEAAASD